MQQHYCLVWKYSAQHMKHFSEICSKLDEPHKPQFPASGLSVVLTVVKLMIKLVHKHTQIEPEKSLPCFTYDII